MPLKLFINIDKAHSLTIHTVYGINVSFKSGATNIKIRIFVNIQNTAIARKTKLYQINLKAMELVAQKAIFLDTVLPEIIPANLDDLIDDSDLSELQKQLERLDVDLELMSDRLEESTSAVGANDVFEELVGEIRRQREIDTVDDLYPENDPIPETEQFKVNRHF